MASLRILIAEPNDNARHVLVAMLSVRAGWEVCGESADGQDAIAKAAELKPDVVLLDSNLPAKDPLAAARDIVQQQPPPKVLLLTNSGTERTARATFQAGAMGFVLRARLTEDLLAAVEAVSLGQTFFTPRFAKRILHDCVKTGSARADQPFSQHEREIMQSLARELTLSLRREPKPARHPLRKQLLMLAVVIAGAAIALVAFSRESGQVLPAVDGLLVSVGLKSPPPTVYGGNPERKVWIDVHTALYHCPGSPLYGKTPKGRYAKQKDAQADHFEPAARKACD